MCANLEKPRACIQNFRKSTIEDYSNSERKLIEAIPTYIWHPSRKINWRGLEKNWIDRIKIRSSKTRITKSEKRLFEKYSHSASRLVVYPDIESIEIE